MFNAWSQKYTLQFKRPGGTSRGILTEKDSWFIFIEKNGQTGIGECSIIRGLSPDPMETYELTLKKVCEYISASADEEAIESWPVAELSAWPSIRFGIEMALKDLQNGGKQILFESPFTASTDVIAINGLVWMGAIDFMQRQIDEKIAAGFDCIKLKIGALNFEEEVELIRKIRKRYSSETLTIRVDANGAFSAEECPEKLQRLARLDIHSIEQPICAGNTAQMAALCASSPLPIALDEELIGISGLAEKKQLLEDIKPPYLILKPSLIGGFKSSEEWIRLAEAGQTDWWVTSALESNIGLNAIAQWTYTFRHPLPQGLGTGQLYINNIPSPLYIENGYLKHGPAGEWKFDALNLRHEQE